MAIKNYFRKLLSPTNAASMQKAQLDSDQQKIYRTIKRSGLFDRAFYFKAYPDVANAGHDPLVHYIVNGAGENRDPSKNFITAYYNLTNPDVFASKLNPLYHYIVDGKKQGRPPKKIYSKAATDMSLKKDYEVIDASALFDRDFYLAVNIDVANSGLDPLVHYLRYGAEDGRNPSSIFDTRYYLKTYEDVAKADMNPLAHYVLIGAGEGRATQPTLAEITSISPGLAEGEIDPAAARILESAIAEIRASALFDPVWYKQTYPAIGDVDPAVHFLEFGGQGFNPSPFFQSDVYLAANADVVAAASNPLLHWMRHGRLEARDPPVRKAKPLLTLAELCDPRRDEIWQSIPPDLRFSILTPTYNTEPVWLRELYQTLRNQTYGGWEWIVCDDLSTRAETNNTLREIAAGDKRVILTPPSEKGRGISATTNAALARATGEFVALVDHDDLLVRDVLARIRDAILAKAGMVDIAYTDECKLSIDNDIYDVFLKPSWSPVLLQNTMYMGHLTVYRTTFVRQLGGLRSEFDGTQDYDLALRASDATKRVVHVPTIGYLWRAVPGSTAASLSEKSYALVRQEKALDELAHKRTADAHVKPGFSLGYWRVNYPLPAAVPSLSFVIPTAGGSRRVRGRSVDLISHCIESLERTAFYPDAEIVVVHNGDLRPEQLDFLAKRARVKLVAYRSDAFNLAEKINLGARAATGDYLCLLNDDVEAVTPGGGEVMIGLMEAQPDVGAIAPLCMFEDGRTQHNGILLLEQGPSHCGLFRQPTFNGHAGFLRCRREVFAVSGAMLFCRRDRYRELGGFDERFPLNYNDVDFCLRLREAGYSCVVDPVVQVYHFESASKIGTFRCEKELLFTRWPGLVDPFFNPGFDQRDPSFEVALKKCMPFPSGDAIDFERWLDRRISYGRGTTDGGVMFSICVPIYNQPAAFLNEMLTAARMQTWPHKEIVLVDDASTLPETCAWLDRLKPGPGLKIIRLAQNQGIVGAQRNFLDHASGDFIIPMDADDFITVDALAIMAEAIAAHPDDDIFYSDEFKSNPASEKFAPFFKTDFDPVLISNSCFTCHLMALRTSFMKAADGYGDRRATWCHDWDTTFRAVAAGRKLIHVSEQLYAWRINPGSTASVESAAKPEAVASQRFVIERAIAQRGLSERLSTRPNPDWPHSGMWSLEAKEPVADVAILNATATWRAPDPSVVLNEAAEDTKAWIAILVATEKTLVDEALSKLSAVAWWEDRVGAVSGCLSQGQGERVLWAGGVFTNKGVIDPSFGATWQDGHYYGRLFGQRCVDVAAPVNVLIRRDRLHAALAWLRERGLATTPSSLMVALGRLAAGEGWLIAVTPLLRTDLAAHERDFVPVDREAIALKGPGPVLTSRWYGASLDPESPFVPLSARSD